MKFPEVWNLETIFDGGAKSIKLKQFINKLQNRRSELESKLNIIGDNILDWLQLINLWQLINSELSEGYSFIGCLEAQNTNDSVATQMAGRLDAFEASIRSLEVNIERTLSQLPDSIWEELIKNPELKSISFFIKRRRVFSRQKMNPELEMLAETLASNGYHAWGRLYDKIAGSLRANLEIEGESHSVSMGQLVHKLEDPNEKIRLNAFQSLEKAWSSVQDLAGMALNSQAGFRLDLYRKRDWVSVLHEPLYMNSMKLETLEAMWQAVAEKSRALVPYLEEKAKLLKVKKIRWSDLVAPVSPDVVTFEYDDAVEYIVECFGKFSGDLAEFTRKAISERWVEVEDRAGKAAGGFCTDFPISRETRIFMTFGKTFGGVSTLAHELGHAYHTWLLRDRPFFSTQYPMALAETASTFCENLIMDARLKNASDSEKLSLLGNIGDDAVMMLMNLRSRFLFEKEFFDLRMEGPLTVDELNQLMIKAQKTAYFNGLAEDGYHPLFWASKLHFYITSMPFYNFPYVFGYLFSNGLSAIALEEGRGFASSYTKILMDSGSLTCEDLASKHLGIDLTKSEFWENAVDRVLKVVPLLKSMQNEE